MPLTKQQLIMVRNRTMAKHAKEFTEQARQDRRQQKKAEVEKKKQLVRQQKNAVNPLLMRHMGKQVATMARKSKPVPQSSKIMEKHVNQSTLEGMGRPEDDAVSISPR